MKLRLRKFDAASATPSLSPRSPVAFSPRRDESDACANRRRRHGRSHYPGLAVAKEVMRRNASIDCRVRRTERGLEARLVPQAGFDLWFIESSGLKNVGMGARLRGLLVLPKSFFAAKRVIREFKPDIVVGAGGYVSGPVLLTAALMRIPTLVMESNALPGFTNRVLARFIDKAAVSFEAALPYFRGKGVVTGNPVRREFFEYLNGRMPHIRCSSSAFAGRRASMKRWSRLYRPGRERERLRIRTRRASRF